MKNATNITKYRRLAPVYDFLFGFFLRNARRKAFASLSYEPGESMLLAGVGTGLDFGYIPGFVNVTGIDISDEMLARAARKAGDRQAALINMNAEAMAFDEGFFDKVVLNLILSVAEDPRAVLSESLRVLKPGGAIIVFDKFIRQGKKSSAIRKLINAVSSSIGTDITRCYEDIAAGLPATVKKDMDSMLGGNYRTLLIEKE